MPSDTININSSSSNNVYTTTNNPYVSSATTWAQYPLQKQYQIEYGWECPRCGKINAPWKSQCDCTRNNWTITCNGTTTNQISKNYTNLNDLCVSGTQVTSLQTEL